MSYQHVLYEVRGQVALITYDRVSVRNAWNVPMCREVMAAVARANEDPSIGAIVITAAGSVFCAGVDFKAAPEPPDPATGRRPNLATITMADDESWLHLLARSKPTIMAINGAAIGFGVTHTLAADIRIGSDSSSFSFPFLRLGTMPELGCTALLPRLVGFGRAVDICLTASHLDAREAHRIGLITRMSADAKLVDTALELAEELAGRPALQTRLTKQMLHASVAEGDLNKLLTTERDAFVTLMKRSGRMGPRAD